MARPLRIQYPGAWYHVTSRGNERKEIFKSKRDREQFLGYLESAHERYDAIIHVYCMMSNHYHLLLETPRANLSQILHHINGAYTTYFNIKRDRSGHLFQGRYKAILMEKDVYCQELSRYIHLNPVRAGIVEKPSEYFWSSYPYYIGVKKSPDWLTTNAVLGYFAEVKSESQKGYRNFVGKALGDEIENPLKEVFASTFLGSKEFIKCAKDKWIGYKNVDARNIPALKELVDRPTLELIGQVVDSIVGKKHPQHRKFCLYISQQIGGYSLKQIGAFYNMRDSAVSQSNLRFNQDIAKDRKLKKILVDIKHSI